MTTQTFQSMQDARQAVLDWSRNVHAAQGAPADFSIETTDMHAEGWDLVFTVAADGATFTGRLPLLSMLDKRHYGHGVN